jgi:hypothetical protein
MRTNDEIRRLNMLVAMKRAGNAAKLAERVATSPAYISQIKNRVPDSKSGTPKAMGDELARRIEAAINEPTGWMDAAHQDVWVELGIVTEEGYEAPALPDGLVVRENVVEYASTSQGHGLVDVSSPDETTLERLNGPEKRLLERYRRASKKGRLMIDAAADVAPRDEEFDLSLRGPK